MQYYYFASFDAHKSFDWFIFFVVDYVPLLFAVSQIILLTVQKISY